MSEKDGGPAFPTNPLINSFGIKSDGMSLLDYFAASVDIPWNAVIETLRLIGEEIPTVDRVCEYRAVMRYCEARAMLVQRAK